MAKSIFEFFAELNQEDTKNNTSKLRMGNALIAVDKIKQGGKVSMGIDEDTMWKIMNGEYIALLIAIEKKEVDNYKFSLT